MNDSSVAIVIPARFHSTRFPGKPLAVVNGKPLIEWVYRRAREVSGVDRVVVATDHKDIADAIGGFGGDVIMTSGNHATGTDRVAEVARGLKHSFVFNLQGDEPVFPVSLLEEMIRELAGSDADIVTASHAIEGAAEMNDTNVVKVVTDRSGNALYFSRAAIPCGHAPGGDGLAGFRHIGIYGFKRASLLRFADAQRTPLEEAENLEQLRALENSMTIRVIQTEYLALGVDVPGDLKNVEKALASV
ncbi:MAG: 3-deoxy-manno-octulosonate cytidylyltransferase [bacterium]|nr:3-deoxy-manno-octulosonate cytidylyltransferase [bacterium]